MIVPRTMWRIVIKFAEVAKALRKRWLVAVAGRDDKRSNS